MGLLRIGDVVLGGGGGGGGGDTSECLPKSASSEFYLTSNPSGFITGVDLSNYATKTNASSIASSIASSYAASAASGKLDLTATGNFYPMTGNPSGFLTSVNLTPYQTTAAMTAYTPKSSISGHSATWDTVSSRQYASAMSAYYLASNPSGFITGVDLSPYQKTANMTAYTPKSAISGQSSTWNTVSARQYASSMSAYYLASNPSGFITGVDLSPYQKTSSMTAYTPKSAISAQSSTWNTVSARQYASAMSAYQPKSSISSWTGQMSSISSKADKTSVKVTATAGGSSQVSSINGSAILDLSTYNALTALSAIITANSAKWNQASAISALTANKYTMVAGAGISITNDTTNKITTIAVV